MYPHIDVWRMSASRPWQLEKTHNDLIEKLEYEGELRFHLIESIIVDELSEECIKFGKNNGYNVHIIDPAKGQGYAIDYALKNVITSEYSLKWEDDFRPVQIIPLTDCVSLMRKYKNINQICFNKRDNLEFKWLSDENGKFKFYKEKRLFETQRGKFFLQVKDRWWFGSSIWRTSFIKPIFQYYEHNTHNYFNDRVMMPMAGFVYGDERNGFKGRKQPTTKQIEEYVGCYLYGYPGFHRMSEHTGLKDSIWYGDLKERWKSEGRKIKGI